MALEWLLRAIKAGHHVPQYNQLPHGLLRTGVQAVEK